MTTGKTIEQAPIPESQKKPLTEYAKRISDFEILVSKNIPEPEKASEVDVSIYSLVVHFMIANSPKYYYQPRTLTEIEKMVPEISVSKYLKAFIPEGYTITPNFTMVVSDINYYKNLSNIIKVTPRESLHDYFQSRIVATWSGRLHRNFTAPARAFSNVMSGKDPNNIPERWRTCINEIDGNLGYILSGAFVERAFSAADKTLGDRIIADIKQVFAKRLQGFEWMTPQVKEAAAKKGALLHGYLHNFISLLTSLL
jgi:endothelin-converting enzyme